MPCKIAPMDSSLACYEGKLVYVANLRVPSEKAHVLQSFKMCEAFRRLGLDVELTYPRRRNTAAMEGVDALSYYDVECPFRLVETNCPDLLRLSANPRIQMMLFVAHSTLFTIQSVRRRWDGNLCSTLGTCSWLSVFRSQDAPLLWSFTRFPIAGRRGAGLKSLLAPRRRSSSSIAISLKIAWL